MMDYELQQKTDREIQELNYRLNVRKAKNLKLIANWLTFFGIVSILWFAIFVFGALASL